MTALGLLALTNGYPPAGYGYQQACRDVMRGLADRGHRVLVLTAGVPGDGDEQDGEALIRPALRTVRTGADAAANARAVGRALAARPDVVIPWLPVGLGPGVLRELEATPVPALYMLCDGWALAPGSRTPPTARARFCFPSDWLRERYAAAGFHPPGPLVVPHGLALDRFRPGLRRPDSWRRPALAFAGRLTAAKGADLAVSALAHLPGAQLELAGGPRGEETALRVLAVRLGVAARVRFRGFLRRDAVAELLGRSDCVLAPGRDPESFGLVALEAMAGGACVVTTALGGAAEVCRDGENALVVPPDARSVGAAVERLQQDAALRERLVRGGLATARARRLDDALDAVERACRSLARPEAAAA